MSRGPGRWQRLLLNTLNERACFYVADLLPAGHSRADRVALFRAAAQLERAGRVVLVYFMCGRPRVVVARRGTMPDEIQRRPLEVRRSSNVVEVAGCDFNNA
jgi:hypothetical protein